MPRCPCAQVVDLYFEDSGSKVEKIGGRLAAPPVDFNEIDQLVHQFKGSSASFGARRMADLCIHMREACQAQDAATCQMLLQQVAEQFQVRFRAAICPSRGCVWQAWRRGSFSSDNPL